MAGRRIPGGGGFPDDGGRGDVWTAVRSAAGSDSDGATTTVEVREREANETK